MLAYLNGRFLDVTRARVSALDRGFLYGDGVFETLPVFGGRPFLWDAHRRRLERGARLLGLRIPIPRDALLNAALELIQRNRLAESILRVQVARGPGRRGDSIRGADSPTLLMTLHPSTGDLKSPRNGWRIVTSNVRILSGDPLRAIKHTNRLPYILARRQADARRADDALVLNERGRVVEAASGNLFWVEGRTVFTPPDSAGALPGITRAFVLGLCKKRRVPVRWLAPTPGRIAKADAAFLTLSTRGIVMIEKLDLRALSKSGIVTQLRQDYEDAVRDFRDGSQAL